MRILVSTMWGLNRWLSVQSSGVKVPKDQAISWLATWLLNQLSKLADTPAYNPTMDPKLPSQDPDSHWWTFTKAPF